MESTGLILLYLLQFGLMLIGAAAIGSLVWRGGGRISGSGLDFIVQYTLGLALCSWIAAWLGLVGALRAGIAGGLLGLLALAGLIRYFDVRLKIFQRTGRMRRPPNRKKFEHFKRLAFTLKSIRAECGTVEWLLLGLGALLLGLLSLNVLIGSLTPDMGQDAMWYHLALPGQWVITGRTSTYPFQMHSNYALAGEALFALCLLASDEILCTLLVGQATLALLWGFTFWVYNRLGWRGALCCLLAVVPAWGVTNLGVPVGAKNDRFAGLFIFAGALLILTVVDRACGAAGVTGRRGEQGRSGRDGRDGTGRRGDGVERNGSAADSDSWAGNTHDAGLAAWHKFGLAGFLFGSAAAVKIIAAAFWLPLALLATAGLALQRRRMAAAVSLALYPCAALAYLPWAIRSGLGSGNPFLPLFYDLFPPRPEYRAAVEASRSLSRLYPFSLEGLQTAFLFGLPAKLRMAFTTPDLMFGLALIGATFALFHKRPFWKLQGLALLACYAVVPAIDGSNEVIRFLNICYPLAALPLALLLVWLRERLPRGAGLALLAALFLGGTFTYCRKVFEWAQLPTIQWRLRPVLTAGQRWAMAQYAEKGAYYRRLTTLQEYIEPQAGVLLLDISYPFYLQRRCVWPGETQRSHLLQLWTAKTPEAAWQWLVRERLDYIVIEDAVSRELIAEMLRRGYLAPVEISEPESPRLRLYRVSD